MGLRFWVFGLRSSFCTHPANLSDLKELVRTLVNKNVERYNNVFSDSKNAAFNKSKTKTLLDEKSVE